MVSEELISGLYHTNEKIPETLCAACELGMFHRQPLKIGRTRVTRIGELVQPDSDVFNIYIFGSRAVVRCPNVKKIFGLHFGKTSISLIGSVWNVNRWRSVKFDVCLDVWHEPNFGLTFDGDVWRSTLRISNVVELNTRRNFLYILHGVFIIVIEFCWYSANWFPIPKLFQTQVFFKFFKLTREVLNFVKKFWRWTSYLMLRKFYVTLTFFWRLTYCFFVDGDVLPERQTSWNLIDVPNTAYWLLWRRLCWWLANTSFNFQICVPSSWRACLLGQSTSTMCSTLHYWSWIRWCWWFGQRSCLVSTTAVRARNWLAPDYHILW